MTPAPRAALALLGALLLAGCNVELNTGLTEREANEEVAILLRHGIPAARAANAKEHTLTVTVEEGRFADAVEVLRAQGLPRSHYAAISDVFRGGGLVTSPGEERMRMVYALGEALSGTIAQIDGVLTARVHIVLPDNDPLRRDAPPTSAAVFIRHAPGAPVDRLVPQIKQLVANGVAGLAYDRVSVVLVPAEQPVPGSAERPAPELRQVAGLWLDRGSVGTLQAMLAAGAAAIALLAALSGWLAWRARAALFRRDVPRLALR